MQINSNSVIRRNRADISNNARSYPHSQRIPDDGATISYSGYNADDTIITNSGHNRPTRKGLKMQNVTIEEKSGKIVITIDASKEFGLSKSGKTTIVASTQGNQPFATQKHGQVVIGLNVYKK